MQENKLLYGIKEAAERLGISPASVRALTQTGALPTVGIGRRRMVHKDDIEKFAKEGHSAGVRQRR